MTILGVLAGIGMTIAVYPHILRRRTKKLLALCSTDAERIGDPVSNYLALLMYQVTQAYERLHKKDIAEPQVDMVNILASYSSFLTMKQNRSESEQGTLDAIIQACNRSEALRCAVDERNNEVSNKSVDEMLEELEKELANKVNEVRP